MLRLGASLAGWQNPLDPDLRVLLDPAGHPFCLIAARSMGVFNDEAERQGALAGSSPSL
jgi:hypothetical protein